MSDRIGNEDLGEGKGMVEPSTAKDTELLVTVDEAVYAMTQVLNGEWKLGDAVAVLRGASTLSPDAIK